MKFVNAIKLTKYSLRTQESRMQQLQKYLPTLQLKKALLQGEINECLSELADALAIYHEKYHEIKPFIKLLSAPDMPALFAALQIEKSIITYDNIAGLEIPVLKEIVFPVPTFSLFSTPFWWDSALQQLKVLLTLRKKYNIIQQKYTILHREFRNVSIRVNLFEKILIPKTHYNIKKIQVFLGDQQLTSIAQSKVAKAKIIAKKLVSQKEML